jgi:GABA permease
MWFFPWLSYVAVLGMATVLIAMAFTPSHRAEFWTSTISIAVVLLAYRAFRHGRSGVPSISPAARPQTSSE